MAVMGLVTGFLFQYHRVNYEACAPDHPLPLGIDPLP